MDEDRRPVIATELTVAGGRITRLAFTQRDPDTKRGLLWNQQLDVALGYADRIDHVRGRLAGASVDVSDARGRPAPLFVLPNGGGIAYGEIHLDQASREWLSARLFRIADPLTRGSAWLALWDAMLDGELAPATLGELALAALPRETDELNVERMLDDLRAIYWRFTSPVERRAIAPRLERVLRSRLSAARTQSLKGAYFVALRSVAQTPDTIACAGASLARDAIPARISASTPTDANDALIPRSSAMPPNIGPRTAPKTAAPNAVPIT